MTEPLPRIALVQMEVKPGRPDLNAASMLRSIREARGRGAEVVVFPELCISGYIVGDLWEVDELAADFAGYSEDIRSASEGVTVLFGNVAVDRARIGEDGRLRKYNAVYVCSDGEYVSRPGLPEGLPPGVQPKTLHPNYRFFDDDRHFYSLRKLAAAEGRSVYDWMVPFEVTLRDGRRFRFGVQLCEDIWCQDYSCGGDILDTLAAYREREAQAVFNLSSSPWTWRKNDKRNRVVRDILERSPLPFFYVNQVGAQNNGKNIVVFDGDSTFYCSDGTVRCRARSWKEDLILLDPGGETSAPPAPEAAAPEEAEVEAVYCAIRTGLRHLDHVRGGENRFLVGVSGGIDSSVVACMLERTFGAGRVFAVNMPTRHNAGVTRDNARLLCERLGGRLPQLPDRGPLPAGRRPHRGDRLPPFAGVLRPPRRREHPGSHPLLRHPRRHRRQARAHLHQQRQQDRARPRVHDPVRRPRRRRLPPRRSLQGAGVRPRQVSQRRRLRARGDPGESAEHGDGAQRRAVAGAGRHPGGWGTRSGTGTTMPS